MVTNISGDSAKKIDKGYSYLSAEEMHYQGHLLAKKLDKLGYIYGLYGALDGFSISYSTIKYCFDVFLGGQGSSSDMMHEWLMTSEGMVSAATGSIALIVFSMFANLFKDNDNSKDKSNAFKKYIAIAWPYCRDTLKGLKNAYKGVKSTLQVINSLGGQNLNFLIVPIGLALGGLSVINRLLYRSMVQNKRKVIKKANEDLLTNVQKSDKLTLEDIEKYRNQIARESVTLREMAFFSAAYGGIVDGLYLYIGVLGICSLAPPVLAFMAIFCTIYLLACIATRMYEEYNFQREVIVTEVKVELALCGKQLQCLYNELYALSNAGDCSDKAIEEQQRLSREMKDLLEKFEEKRRQLRSLSTHSYKTAFFSGLRSGLAAYGALASAMFAVATILVLCSVAFPPVLLISCISIGVFLLAGFIAHSMNHVRQQKLLEEKDDDLTGDVRLSSIRDSLKVKNEIINNLKPEEVKKAIGDRMVVDPSPQFFFQEWFEVVRSFFSAMGKSKDIDLPLNPLQEQDEKGHYHDSPTMLPFMAISVVVHAAILTLRALAKGLAKADTKKRAANQDKEEAALTSSGGESDEASKQDSDFQTPPPSARKSAGQNNR
ncbi:hypothetical protein [Legionella sp. W10-070]|uniref:hypothetical protein n=1 Tax=Legionella sp. W10-070 TaxID=1117709 RepID=UPI0010555DAE|nr:hypothetical protein [Legionella sp. W10-070]